MLPIDKQIKSIEFGVKRIAAIPFRNGHTLWHLSSRGTWCVGVCLYVCVSVCMSVSVCVRVNSIAYLTKERALLNTHDMLPLPAAPPSSLLLLLPLPARCEGLLATIVNRRTGCGFAIRRSYDYEKDDKDDDDDDGEDNERALSNVCT